MKRKILKLLSVILGLIVSACSIADETNPPAPMYGMPSAEYKVNGTVKNESGDPIEGIQITLNSEVQVYSDENGEWLIEDNAVANFDESILEVEDIDGTDNGGEFSDKTVELTLTQTEDGDGDWDEGTYEQHDIDIVLTEETEE